MGEGVVDRRRRSGRRVGRARIVAVLLLLLVAGLAIGSGLGSAGIVGWAGTTAVTVVVGLVGLIAGAMLWRVVSARRADLGFGYAFATTHLGAGGGLLETSARHGWPSLATVLAVVLLGLGLVFGVLGAFGAAIRKTHADRNLLVEAARDTDPPD